MSGLQVGQFINSLTNSTVEFLLDPEHDPLLIYYIERTSQGVVNAGINHQSNRYWAYWTYKEDKRCSLYVNNHIDMVDSLIDLQYKLTKLHPHVQWEVDIPKFSLIPYSSTKP